MKHLKTLSSTFIPPAFCVLVEVGNRREVNTSAYLSHWFQGSCYGLSLQISSLYCLQPTSYKITPLHRRCLVRYFTSLLTDVVRFEGGKSDFKSPDSKRRCSLSVYLFSGFEHMSPQSAAEEGGAYASLPLSVQLTVSWHSWCNRVGQDRSGPLVSTVVITWTTKRAKPVATSQGSE